MHQLNNLTFKFFNNKSPAYMGDGFKPAGHPNISTRASFFKLNQPLQKVANDLSVGDFKNLFDFKDRYTYTCPFG